MLLQTVSHHSLTNLAGENCYWNQSCLACIWPDECIRNLSFGATPFPGQWSLSCIPDTSPRNPHLPGKFKVITFLG